MNVSSHLVYVKQSMNRNKYMFVKNLLHDAEFGSFAI